MKIRLSIFFFASFVLLLLTVRVPRASAQMMGRGIAAVPTITGTPATEEDHAGDVEAGKALYERINNHELTCKDLDDQDFSLLGEYFMEQHTGSPEAHDRMDRMLTAMAGEDGEYNIHVWWGKRGTNCVTGEDPSTVFGKGGSMMGFGGMMGFGSSAGGWGFGGTKYGMMGGSLWGWHSVVLLLVTILVVVNLVFLAIWLWKQITK